MQFDSATGDTTLKSIATVLPSLAGSLRETSISKRSAARGFVGFCKFVSEMGDAGVVLLAPQTNVERQHAFDDGSDSSYMFECAGRVSRAVRRSIRPCCLCSDKICRHCFVGVYQTVVLQDIPDAHSEYAAVKN